MTLTYFTTRSIFVNLALLLEKVKEVDFSETIAACDFKLMDLMKIRGAIDKFAELLYY